MAIRMAIYAVRHYIKPHKISQDDQFELKHNSLVNIPEVTYNYHEYKEPLIGPEYRK